MKAPRIRSNTTDEFILNKAGKCGPDPLNLDNSDNGAVSVEDFITLHQLELPLLLNPYWDNPADFFAWKVDDTIEEVEIAPLNDDVEKVCDAAEDGFGLNRKELRDLRYRKYSTYRTFKNLIDSGELSQNLLEDVQKQIDSMKTDKALFAGMIRYFDQLPPNG